MKILVSGSSGLVGSALMRHLAAQGHEPVRLVRSRQERLSQDIFWDPDSGEIEFERLERMDAVVHLAGENIASGRWTAQRKARIRHSRVAGTELLCSALAELAHPPSAVISASAVGYYGDRGDEPLDEDSESGHGFLASVCRDWETATFSAQQAGIRVVNLRLGVVLSPLGGALARLLPVFRRGLGGRLGNGRMYMSWIMLDEVLRGILHCLQNEELAGPVNAVTPQPISNAEFTNALARRLNRPAMLPVPAWAIRLGFGEMGREALLSSARVFPKRLLDTHFSFQYPEISSALRRLLDESV